MIIKIWIWQFLGYLFHVHMCKHVNVKTYVKLKKKGKQNLVKSWQCPFKYIHYTDTITNSLISKTLILFSDTDCQFSFCIYRFETVNINLKQKPDWFRARNPIGLVPVLEFDDKIVYESNVCNEYLDNIYPTPKLIPTDFYQASRDKMLWETFGKVNKLQQLKSMIFFSFPYQISSYWAKYCG